MTIIYHSHPLTLLSAIIWTALTRTQSPSKPRSQSFGKHHSINHNFSISLFLFTMSLFTTQRKQQVLATAGMQPSLLQQIGMAGAAAVITVTFIHPIDVVKVSQFSHFSSGAALVDSTFIHDISSADH
jgi:hypothetical protein